MNDFYLESELKRREAVVVHFSHHSNMRDGGTFPEDLQQAIANNKDWVLSTCVVWPGHPMRLPGDIGVIFSPSVASVVSVSNDDSGSMTTSDGVERSLGEELSYSSFERTFDVSGAYNEWRIKGANVLGIYIRNPHSMSGKKVRKMNAPTPIETIAPCTVELAEVLAAFPLLKFYTHDSSKLVEIPP